MDSAALDQRIAEFLHRKDAQFPKIDLFGRNETRTIKFPVPRRVVSHPHGL